MFLKPNARHRGFTLIEIMIVISIIALLAAIAMPNYLRSRKRAQATQILEDLRLIDSGVDLYALEYNKSGGHAVDWSDVQNYLKAGSRLYGSGGVDLLGNAYTMPNVDGKPTVPAATFTSLSDVAPNDFWSPYR